MEWLRWYHGAHSDSKWPVVARKSKQNIGTVVSIWVALLEHASQNDYRGKIDGFDSEEIDVLFGYEDGTTDAVISAMREKELIIDNYITAWDKRQPEREDRTATERKRRQRERESQQVNITQTSHDVTHTSRDVTTDKNREDKNREETPLPPLTRGNVCEPFSAAPKPKPRCDVTQERFEEFWKAYPRKVGKDAAFKAFKKIVTTKDTLDDILKALKWQSESNDWTKDEGQFIPHPTTYLNQGRWKDEDTGNDDGYAEVMAKLDAETEELSRQAKERKRQWQEAREAANGL